MQSSGEWDDYFEYIIFATKDKKYAEDYIRRLNSLVSRIRVNLIHNLNKEDRNLHVRWRKVKDLNEAFIRETKLRKV